MGNQVFIDGTEKRKELPEFAPDQPCPICGGKVALGFGFAGGGLGCYTYCDNCQKVVSKSVEPEDGGFDAGD